MNLAQSLNRRKNYILSLKTILLCILAMSIIIVGRSGFSHADEQIYYKPLSARSITKEEAKANSAGKIILFYGEPIQGAEAAANTAHILLKKRNPTKLLPLIEVYKGGEENGIQIISDRKESKIFSQSDVNRGKVSKLAIYLAEKTLMKK